MPLANAVLLSLIAAIFIIGLIVSESQSLADQYGVVPLRLAAEPSANAIRLVTSMFIHADWLGAITNIWILTVFGNALEDIVGHLRYLVYYLLSGVATAVIWAVCSPASSLPLVGAAGAVSSTLGAYLVLDPRARVRTFVLVIPVVAKTLPVPIWIFVGLFFVFHLVASTISVAEGRSAVGLTIVSGLVVGQLVARSTAFARP